MTTPEFIFEDFRCAGLPSADQYGYDTDSGLDLDAYLAAWRVAERVADARVHAIVRVLADPRCTHKPQLKKLQRHSEKCRLLAIDTCAVWERTSRYRKQGQLNALEIAWTFLGNKTNKERWCAAEEKAIRTATRKAERTYISLCRERQLLLTEIDASTTTKA